MRGKTRRGKLQRHRLDPIRPSAPSSFIRVISNQLHIPLQSSPSTAVATLPYRPSWRPKDWLVPAVHAAHLHVVYYCYWRTPTLRQQAGQDSGLGQARSALSRELLTGETMTMGHRKKKKRSFSSCISAGFVYVDVTGRMAGPGRPGSSCPKSMSAESK